MLGRLGGRPSRVDALNKERRKDAAHFPFRVNHIFTYLRNELIKKDGGNRPDEVLATRSAGCQILPPRWRTDENRSVALPIAFLV